LHPLVASSAVSQQDGDLPLGKLAPLFTIWSNFLSSTFLVVLIIIIILVPLLLVLPRLGLGFTARLSSLQLDPGKKKKKKVLFYKRKKMKKKKKKTSWPRGLRPPEQQQQDQRWSNSAELVGNPP